MTIESLKSFSLVFGINTALISTQAALSEFKKGKIHLLDEVISRSSLAYGTVTLAKKTLEKLDQTLATHLLGSGIKRWAIILTPAALGYVKHRIQTSYPLLTKSISYLENCIEKSTYVVSIISSIALVRFGHFLAGYTGLSVLLLGQILSNNFIRTHIPLIDKVNTVFTIYISPIASLLGAVIGGSPIFIAYDVYGLISMTYQVFTADSTQVQDIPTDTNIKDCQPKLTLEKWKELHANPHANLLTINQERVPKLILPRINTPIDTKQAILHVISNLPQDLQKKFITRVNNLPERPNVQTFEEAKSIAQTYLDQVTAYANLQPFSIWNSLLQQSCVAMQDNDPNKQFLGVLEILFGNEGQCQIAHQRNILSGFLTLCKTTGHEITALKFHLALENILSENFRLFLGSALKGISSCVNLLQRKVDQSYFFQRPFFILLLLLFKFVERQFDLTDMHNYQRNEKNFGPLFGIKPIAKDLVAEISHANTLSNPILDLYLKNSYKALATNASATYFQTQLQKITPWLHKQIDANFTPSEISLWFNNWIEKQNISDKEELQDEFIDDQTIAGYPIFNSDQTAITPTALIAFLYEMEVLTDASKKSPLSMSVEEMQQTVHKDPQDMPKDLLCKLEMLDIDPNIVFV